MPATPRTPLATCPGTTMARLLDGSPARPCVPLAGFHGVVYEASLTRGSARTTSLHKCLSRRSPERLPVGVRAFTLCWKATHLAPVVLTSPRGLPPPDSSPASGRVHGRPTGGAHGLALLPTCVTCRLQIEKSDQRQSYPPRMEILVGGVSASTEGAVFGFQERCDIFLESQVALGLAIAIGQRNMSRGVRSADLPGPASGSLQDGPGGPRLAWPGCPKPSATWLPPQI